MQWEQLLCPIRQRESQVAKRQEDGRNAFEKDYHRILQSASFRRLQDKTQVFPLDPSDFVRTRLTHSLEVSSLAKSLAQRVCCLLAEEQQKGRTFACPLPTDQQAKEMADLLLAAGLVHDIGNPPFGHFGETAIRQWFERHLKTLYVPHMGRQLQDCLPSRAAAQDFLHFEGNAQALRVLSRLHFQVDEHGMNLSLPLLNVLIKYPTSSLYCDEGHEEVEWHKLGYFQSEQLLFRRIIQSTGTGLQQSPPPESQELPQQTSLFPLAPTRLACRHPLTFLLEAADDIAYCTADIEDAYKKNKISYTELKLALRRYPKLLGYDKEGGRAYARLLRDLSAYYKRALKNKYSEPEFYALQNWLVKVQSFALEAVAKAFVQQYDALLSGDWHKTLLEVSEAQVVIHVLGRIAVDYVFRSKQILKRELSAHSILSYLLDRFIPAVLVYDVEGQQLDPINSRLIRLISENYRLCYEREKKGKSPEERLYLRLLLVTDFLSGMTDHYAQSLYQELTGMNF